MLATDAVSRALEPLRLRYLDSPLPGWLRASGEAMLALLPVRLRHLLGAQQRRLQLGVHDGELWLHALVDEQSTLIGAVPTDNADLLEQLRAHLDENAATVPRWLLLDADSVLRPVLTLPAAAESRLRELLVHEIDRQTPFGTDQVSFEWRILSRDAASRQLRVELVVLPKVRLEAALSALGPLAQGLAGADALDSNGRRLGVNLLPTARRGAHVDRARMLNMGLVAVTVIALFLAMWVVLDNRAQALADLTARVEAANADVRQVRKLRSSLDKSVQAANFLAKQRAQQPTMLELIADLTRRIPDNTSLDKLSINDGKIVLIGQSQQAPALVGLLQSSKLMKTPALAGAVQTDPRTGKDRFTLTANIARSSQEATDVPARRNP